MHGRVSVPITAAQRTAISAVKTGNDFCAGYARHGNILKTSRESLKIRARFVEVKETLRSTKHLSIGRFDAVCYNSSYNILMGFERN